MAGLYYEEFQVGQKFIHPIRRTVIEMDNMLFSALTYNPAAVHIDYEYAARTEFGKPLVNSLFTLGLMVGLSIHDTTLGTTVANLGMSETTFPKPVFIGDTIRVETEVMDKRLSRSRPGEGIVSLQHCAFNQRDELVCRTRREALMLTKPQ
jgi:acyl dehydratase